MKIVDNVAFQIRDLKPSEVEIQKAFQECFERGYEQGTIDSQEKFDTKREALVLGSVLVGLVLGFVWELILLKLGC